MGRIPRMVRERAPCTSRNARAVHVEERARPRNATETGYSRAPSPSFGAATGTRVRRPLVFRTVVVIAAAVSCPPHLAHAHGERDLPSEDKPSPPLPPPSAEPGEPAAEWYSVHYQFTASTQYHPPFFSKYPAGQNSLSSDAESATAFVTTLYGDMRLWPGAELLFDPEMSGGEGLSGTHGVAAFPSGIVYRVGDPAPAIYVARLAISQTFPLGGGKLKNEAAPNELQGTRNRNQLAITIGRLSVTDVFDANRYSNDPTSQFFNWGLFASGAWDYPADTRGYTYGVLADLAVDWWSARAGIALEPREANGADLDWRIDKARGLMVEYEGRYAIRTMPGACSLLLFFNTADMGSYEQLLADPARYGNDVANTRADGRSKYGFALSMEQQITKTLGAFMRLSYGDGHNEAWAFTEIDQSVALGVVQKGGLWGRPQDEAGAAVVASGLSPWHERYLAGGGYGFIIGDGWLHYGPEVISDIYYQFHLSDALSLAAFYQPIVNPAYNQDRGPVHVLSARLHVAF
jgi:high affinity Mn2+ porin